MHRFLLMLMLVVVSLCSYSQPMELNDFSGIHSSGPLPLKIGSYSREGYSVLLAHCKSERSSDKEFRKFSKGNAIALEQIVKSGAVLFGDSISSYLGKILDVVLEGEPEIRKEIEVYAYKSSVVNAFMMPNGLLFVNLGLVANSTCEAELAFILAHELIHYTECHNLDLFLERMRKDWSEKDYVFDYLEYHSRSRQHENQADQDGLKRFYLKTPYSIAAVENAFRILEYAHLPFDEYPLERKEVESSVYRFDDDFFIDRYNSVKHQGLYLDTLSTHPNIAERRNAMQRNLTEETIDAKKRFLFSEEEFSYVRDLARFECVNQMLLEGDFVTALYNTRILSKVHPKNKFLSTARVASFYGISKVKNLGLFDNLPSNKDAEGAIHTLVHFVNKLNKKEATTLALREAWLAFQQYPDDPYLGSITDDLMKDLIEWLKFDMTEFSDFGINDSSFLTVKDAEEEQTKYDKLEASYGVVPQKDWGTYRYMLADIKQDKKFRQRFNNAVIRSQSEQLDNLTYRKPKYSAYAKYPLSFQLMEPKTYLLNDRRRTGGAKLIAKHRKAGRVISAFSIISKPLKLDIEMISEGGFQKAGSYERYCQQNQIEGEMQAIRKLQMLSYSCRSSLGSDIAEDERYLVSFEQISSKGSTLDAEMLLFTLISIFQYPLLPIGLYNTFIPEYRNKMVMSVIDRKEGRVIFENTETIYSKPGMDYVNDFIYRSLLQSKSLIYSQHQKSK